MAATTVLLVAVEVCPLAGAQSMVAGTQPPMQAVGAAQRVQSNRLAAMHAREWAGTRPWERLGG